MNTNRGEFMHTHTNTKRHLTALAIGASLAALGVVSSALPAAAQKAAFPDTSANHWAYEYVQDLAAKGYIKGYPDGTFQGRRALSRYEMATVIDRIAQTLGDLQTKVAAIPTAPVTPTGQPVTQADLDKVNALVDSFRKELDAIQSVTAGATSPFQDQIDALRQDVLDTKDLAAKAQATANNSYGAGSARKFAISGYVQARFVGGPHAESLYPQGANTPNSSYNGDYAAGSNPDGFQVRRARIKFTGQPTDNARYGIQIDTSGAVSATNQQVTVREGYVAYTFGDGSAKNPTVTAGLFATPFGYQVPASTSSILTPERPLAFNESSVGIWAGDEYDKGVQLGYNTPQQLLFLPAGLKLTAALLNGTGRNSEEVDRHVDQAYRIAYQTTDKQFGAGVSYYDGQLPSGLGQSGFLGVTAKGAFTGLKKQLFGVDAQYVSNAGPFVLGEYEGGKYEQITAFGQASLTAPAPTYPVTNPFGLGTKVALGNKIEGYYVQGGYTFSPLGNHPLSGFVSYDVLKRANSGPLENGSYEDENVGYGASYGLDKATRLRVFYQRPSKVAHAPTVAEPPKVALTTAELQIKF